MEAGNVYRILVAKDCRKSIDKASHSIKLAVEDAFSVLSVNPTSGSNIKILQGKWSGHYRYRIGSYRLIYSINNKQILIKAVRFASRGDVYK